MNARLLFPAGLAAAIVAAGLLQHRKIQRLTNEVSEAEERAASLSLKQASSSPDSPPGVPSASQPQREAAASRIATLLQRLASTDLSAPGKEAAKDLLDLSPAEAALLASRLQEGDGFDPGQRVSLVRFVVQLLAARFPEAMLKLYISDPSFSAGQGGAPYLIASAVESWAKSNPLGAARWLKEQHDQHPELVNEAAEFSLLAGAARRDPALSFSLMKELGLEQEPKAWQQIGESAKSPEEQLALLTALRTGLSEIDDPTLHDASRSAALGGLARQVLSGGWASSQQWLKDAKLSNEETQLFISELHPWLTRSESGQWLDWLPSRLPDESVLRGKASELLYEWTLKDYPAAGQWLSSNTSATPALRNTEIFTYAGAVMAVDPAGAAQWAATMSPGEMRNQALSHAIEVWRQTDPTAADAFASKPDLNLQPPQSRPPQ